MEMYDGSTENCNTTNVTGSIPGIFFQFWEGALGPSRLGKVEWYTPKLGNLLYCTILSFLVNKKTNELLHILLP